MKKLLLVIDVQKSFITDVNKNIVKKIQNLIDNNKYDLVAFTRFINDNESLWYKKLNYQGCLTDEDRKIELDTKNYKIFDKKVYTALNNELKIYLQENKIDEIYLCGFETDACILKTALDLFENNYNVKVLKDYCMSYSKIECHNNALQTLKKLIGKDNII